MELLKDQMEEVEEQASLVNKELRAKNSEYEVLKRSHAETQRAVQLLQVFIQLRLICNFGHSSMNFRKIHIHLFAMILCPFRRS